MKNKIKVLFWDIETKPVKFWGWRTGKQHVNHSQICDGEKFDIICIAYKWAHEKKTHVLHWNLKTQSSKKMINKFSKIVSKADVALGHNGDKFDVKQFNTQQLLHEADPVLWPTTEDTIKQFKKHFYMTSFSLDYLSKLLLGEGKSPMSFDDWKQIVENKSRPHLSKMMKYCKRDVGLTQRIYDKAKRFFTPKVNASIILHDHKNGCPACGSLELRSEGIRVTTSGKYRRSSCMKCGHQFKGRPVKLNK